MQPLGRIAWLALGIAIVASGSSPARALAPRKTSFEQARQRMVDEEIVAAGIKDQRVIDAVRATPRHEFMAMSDRELAYFDMAVSIGEGQTISPPFVVAYMTEQIEPQPTDKVLEIGTGSGYQAAILSPLVKEVYSIEIVEPLGKRAARTLKRLKYANVFTKIGDGFQGWPEHAPFDKIIVTCSPESVPQPLIDQLREGGRMVIPLGERYQQILYLYKKQDGKLVSESLRPTLFVPMTGTAESQRQVLPDPLQPELQNGGFEQEAPLTDEAVRAQEKVAGWHYQRQLASIEGMEHDLAPEGKRYLRFQNLERGRNSAALQGFAVDGRQVHELQVALSVRTKNVLAGQKPDQVPALVVMFYDEQRGMLGEATVGPWRGTHDWQRETSRLRVPPRAREAIVRVGLFGAVGEFDIDNVQISAVSAAATK